MTVDNATSSAFSQPGPNVTGTSLERHQLGDAVFEATFIAAPAEVHPGLGPLFNTSSCRSCHVSDGRGHPPAPGEPFLGMLLRVSQAGADAHGGPVPVDGLGTQLQLRALPGSTPEATVTLEYRDSSAAFADGEAYHLRIPTYHLADVASNTSGLLVSPRVAPPNFGLGLLEAVDESTVLAHSDPEDADADGISGRPNHVWDGAAGRTALGRFGLKANTPTLLQQVASAFQQDMGVTSSVFPEEPCPASVNGCGPHPADLPDDLLQVATHYVRTLGVPARRRLDDASVQQGEQLFREAGCAGCHLPTVRTGILSGVPEASQQEIHPYTDLLVHDMGEELADGRPDFEASGREWRTTPLWGVGLTAIVNGHQNFLHDGRARSLLEAVLWHGGEAAAARERVRAMVKADRDALIAFLESL